MQRAVFTLDGEVIASANAPDFSASIDPKEHPTLADGTDHSLQVVLIDSKGEQIQQASNVMVAFETRAVNKPPPATNVANSKDRKKNTIPLILRCGKKLRRNTSCAGLRPGAMVFPAGILNVPR